MCVCMFAELLLVHELPVSVGGHSPRSEEDGGQVAAEAEGGTP